MIFMGFHWNRGISEKHLVGVPAIRGSWTCWCGSRRAEAHCWAGVQAMKRKAKFSWHSFYIILIHLIPSVPSCCGHFSILVVKYEDTKDTDTDTIEPGSTCYQSDHHMEYHGVLFQLCTLQAGPVPVATGPRVIHTTFIHALHLKRQLFKPPVYHTKADQYTHEDYCWHIIDRIKAATKLVTQALETKTNYDKVNTSWTSMLNTFQIISIQYPDISEDSTRSLRGPWNTSSTWTATAAVSNAEWRPARPACPVAPAPDATPCASSCRASAAGPEVC